MEAGPCVWLFSFLFLGLPRAGARVGLSTLLLAALWGAVPIPQPSFFCYSAMYAAQSLWRPLYVKYKTTTN